MLCVCFSAPTLLDMQFQMCQSMNTGPGDWGEGGIEEVGEDRATLGEKSQQLRHQHSRSMLRIGWAGHLLY